VLAVLLMLQFKTGMVKTMVVCVALGIVAKVIGLP